MTNKPIIVDGVDVSGCDFLAKEDDYCSYSGEYRAYKGQCGCSDEEMCKDHPNCFYKKALKQLQRKAQECEQLKDELATYGATGICETCTEKSILQNDKYIKALREIKEIAEEQIPYLNIDKAKTIIEVEYDYADKIYNLEQRMYIILQKIIEVENDR